MNNQENTPDKNGHGDHEENFRRYEANHGLVPGTPGKTVPREDLPDVESEDLRDESEATAENLAEASDITPDDLQALGSEELGMDMGEDEELRHRPHPVDFSGNDLDVPGVEDDDAQEKLGSEDEENNSYSLGGDRHEDAEDENPDIVQ